MLKDVARLLPKLFHFRQNCCCWESISTPEWRIFLAVTRKKTLLLLLKHCAEISKNYLKEKILHNTWHCVYLITYISTRYAKQNKYTISYLANYKSAALTKILQCPYSYVIYYVKHIHKDVSNCHLRTYLEYKCK